jgi:DNA polymerase III subunit epsilon
VLFFIFLKGDEKMDFIAIDFEIANSNYNSACSMGLVFVQNNQIIDEKYYVIKPPKMELDEEMSKVHGLTIEDLENAPTFDEVWNEISHYFHEENYIIAHNAQFDMNVLKNCLITYSLDIPEFKYIDSITISTRACRGEGIGNSLKERAQRFGIAMNNHHNALSDARVCAELVIKCIEEMNRKSIQSYINTYSSIPVRLFSELKLQTSFNRRNKHKFNKISVKEIVPNSSEFDKEHPFFEKNLVFTGELGSIERKEAMQRAVDVGAIVKSGVSRKTNYLIVGKQDKTLVGGDGMSTKEEKAYELIEQGFDIKIINEELFLELLGDRVKN